ncbi:MAG: zinc-ribbon domain-containing protein [Neglectibacter sp.]
MRGIPPPPPVLVPSYHKGAVWQSYGVRCGHEWEAVIASRTKGHGCPKCSKRKK